MKGDGMIPMLVMVVVVVVVEVVVKGTHIYTDIYICI
jgi:hypothetical protein